MDTEEKPDPNKNYCTIKEIARRWGVSERRVAQMCKEGHIDGAVQQRRFWLIPEDAVKPADGRVAEGGSAEARAQEAESMRNTILGEDSLLSLRNLKEGSVDLIMSELPLGEDGSGRKPLALNRVWTEFRRIIKPDGYIVLLSSGVHTAEIILSNPKEFRYKFVWVKNTEPKDGRKPAPGANHMDVCVFSYMGDGALRTKNIEQAEKEGIFHLEDAGSDTLRFCTGDGMQMPSVREDKLALGSFLACAYTDPGDFVVDNAGYTGCLISGAMFVGRDVSCIQKDVQKEEKPEAGDIAFTGLPGDLDAAYYGYMRKRRLITEYYSNMCWNNLFITWMHMPEKRRAMLTPSKLTESFEKYYAKASARQLQSTEDRVKDLGDKEEADKLRGPDT